MIFSPARPLLAATMIAIGSMAFPFHARAVTQYWNTDGVSRAWTDANWSLSSGGPFTDPWVAGNVAHFTANSVLTGATTDIGGVTVDDGVHAAITAPGGTLGTNGAQATITVGNGGVFDWINTQAISTAAGTGFIKNGLGIFKTGNTGAYPGGFTLNDGTVIINGASGLGNGTLTLNGGRLTANSNRNITAIPSINVGGDFTIGGATTGVTSGDAVVTANIAFSAGVDLGGQNREITIGGNSINATTGMYTFSGIISNGGLTVNATGTGRLILQGANTYTGGTTINGGILVVNANETSLGTGDVTFDNAGGGTLLTTSALAVPNQPKNNLVINAGKVAVLGSDGGSTYYGGVRNDSTVTTLTGAGAFKNYQGNTQTLQLAADISGFEGTFELNNAGGTFAFNLANLDDLLNPQFPTSEHIAASMNGSKARFVLNGSSTARFVRFGDPSTGADNPGLIFRMGELSGNGNIINPNGGAGNVVVEVGELGDANTSTTWGGILVDSTSGNSRSSLHKVGAGTLTLTGNSTYTGPVAGTLPGGLTAGTTVSGGKLIINGPQNTGNGSYEVRTGGTLGGIGNIHASAVTVNAGGFLAPGDPASTNPGMFSVGSAVIDGTLKIEFGNNAIDHLSLPFGSLDLTNATLDLSAIADLANGSYVFLTYGSLVGGNEFANLPPLPSGLSIHHDIFAQTFSLVGEYVHSLPGDFNGDLVVNAADYVVWRDTMSDQPGKYDEWKANFGAGSGGGAVVGGQTAVPEPASLALAACLALGVVGYRWRRES